MRKSGRIESIDFWRGVVLVTIFVDHVPGNPFASMTHRNFGFSDAAEAFVFLSGLVLGFVNWPLLAAGRWTEAARRSIRRAGVLYLVQVSLSLGAVALFGFAYLSGGGEAMLNDDNRALFFAQPASGLVGLAALTYQFGYFNILSVYVALMVMAAGMFYLIARDMLLALSVSFALYVAARFGLVMPSWPLPHTWFLNPFAWQFLFVLGIIVGSARRVGPVPYSRPLFVASALFLAFALLVSTGVFGLFPAQTGSLWAQLDPDKGILGWSRLVHFLALAYVLANIGVAEWLLKFRPGKVVAELGRQSLSIFAAGSVLSAIGQIILLRIPREQNPLAFYVAAVAIVAAGTCLMIGLARYLTWRQSRLAADRAQRKAVLAGGFPMPQSSP